MSELRIYGIARTRAFRVLWMAEDLGLDYDHIPIEIGPAGARKPEYLAINPNGRLPAIDEAGFTLWESLAITLYLAKKHGRFYPTTLESEARAWQWSLWAVQEVDRGVNIWSLHAVRLPPQERDPQRRAEALKCWARNSRWPTSMWPPSSAARSIWISPQRRALLNGSNAVSSGRRRGPRAHYARRPMPRSRSR